MMSEYFFVFELPRMCDLLVANTTIVICNKGNPIEEKGWIGLPHPPRSPDVNPCEFNCFAHNKAPLIKRTVQHRNRELDSIIDETILELIE